MLSNANSGASQQSSARIPLILDRTLVRTCHITLPDTPKPVAGILFKKQLYSYVRFYPTLETAQRGYERLLQRGNLAVLTRISKGLVLWVCEPDARLAK